MSEFTKSERMVLRCASYGLTTDQTATKLMRSTTTVKYHRTNVLMKLRASNITHAVALAYEGGIFGQLVEEAA
jgi:DNA-binding CsgD family transcriptional regulator